MLTVRMGPFCDDPLAGDPFVRSGIPGTLMNKKDIAPALGGFRTRKRGDTEQTVMDVRRACPRCGGKLVRIHRRPVDRLQSAFLPVSRFRCFTAPCGYETNMINWKRQPAGVKRKPLLRYRRVAAALLAGILTIGVGLYLRLVDPSFPVVSATSFPRVEVQPDPTDGQPIVPVELSQYAGVPHVEMPPRAQSWSIIQEQK
jgi:hypothetical protein